MQEPLRQRCPALHARPLPHTHVPALQLSADTELHAAQEAPPVPHAATLVEVTHVPAAQQPLGHVVALH